MKLACKHHVVKNSSAPANSGILISDARKIFKKCIKKPLVPCPGCAYNGTAVRLWYLWLRLQVKNQLESSPGVAYGWEETLLWSLRKAICLQNFVGHTSEVARRYVVNLGMLRIRIAPAVSEHFCFLSVSLQARVPFPARSARRASVRMATYRNTFGFIREKNLSSAKYATKVSRPPHSITFTSRGTLVKKRGEIPSFYSKNK